MKEYSVDPYIGMSIHHDASFGELHLMPQPLFVAGPDIARSPRDEQRDNIVVHACAKRDPHDQHDEEIAYWLIMSRLLKKAAKKAERRAAGLIKQQEQKKISKERKLLKTKINKLTPLDRVDFVSSTESVPQQAGD